MTRFVNVLGWIGTALVVAAVAIRFIRPEQQQIWQRLAMAGAHFLGDFHDLTLFMMIIMIKFNRYNYHD